MSDINEAMESLRLSITSGNSVPVTRATVKADDLRALLDDHARLQADAERLDWLEGFVRRACVYGASFDFARPCEGEPGGFRFMTRHRLDSRQSTLRAAIDAAKAVQP